MPVKEDPESGHVGGIAGPLEMKIKDVPEM